MGELGHKIPQSSQESTLIQCLLKSAASVITDWADLNRKVTLSWHIPHAYYLQKQTSLAALHIFFCPWLDILPVCIL